MQEEHGDARSRLASFMAHSQAQHRHSQLAAFGQHSVHLSQHGCLVRGQVDLKGWKGSRGTIRALEQEQEAVGKQRGRLVRDRLIWGSRAVEGPLYQHSCGAWAHLFGSSRKHQNTQQQQQQQHSTAAHSYMTHHTVGDDQVHTRVLDACCFEVLNLSFHKPQVGRGVAQRLWCKECVRQGKL